jgi:hypothetical protein
VRDDPLLEQSLRVVVGEELAEAVVDVPQLVVLAVEVHNGVL